MKVFCSYYNENLCKSCDLITLDYPAQISHKEKTLRDSLDDFKTMDFLPSVHSPPLHFRNKVKLVVTGTVESPVIGLWGEEDLDIGRELLNCPIQLKEINSALPMIKEFITLAKVSPYQIANRKGELKGLILFHSSLTHETYLRFILRSKESIDRLKKNLVYLKTHAPHIKCISVNIQPLPHAILEGEEEIFLTQETSIHHKLSKHEFLLGPRAFVQTNQFVAEKLYETAAEWIQESKSKRFMELYCGQGAFSFFAAPVIDEGIGIEINPDAVEVANSTARKLGLNHLHFKASDAKSVHKEMLDFSPEVLLINPPRRGLADALEMIIKQAPETIIYSSCNHETLVLDLKKLSDLYHIKRVQIFDMFPHTKHFETLVELKKINEAY